MQVRLGITILKLCNVTSAVKLSMHVILLALTGWDCHSSIAGMRSRWIPAVVVIVLLGCLLCPFLESSDRNDNVFQNGNDTELSLAAFALCVAATYALAKSILLICQTFSVLRRRFRNPSSQWTGVFGIKAPLIALVSSSPPLSSLRI